MNPFTDYLPMYPPNSLPERPWWVWDGPYGTNPETGAYEAGSLYRRGLVRHWVASTADQIAALDAYDAAHPLPCPRPMAGQVWVSPNGCEHTVTSGRTVPGGEVYPFAVASSAQIVGRASSEWPVPGWVLVLGPTPWGRDRPWAPVGWRP